MQMKGSRFLRNVSNSGVRVMCVVTAVGTWNVTRSRLLYSVWRVEVGKCLLCGGTSWRFSKAQSSVWFGWRNEIRTDFVELGDNTTKLFMLLWMEGPPSAASVQFKTFVQQRHISTSPPNCCTFGWVSQAYWSLVLIIFMLNCLEI
jgi:hypothetical protein